MEKNNTMILKPLGVLVLISLILIALILPINAAVPADYDPQVGSVTCPDGKVYTNITACYAGDKECTASPFPCND